MLVMTTRGLRPNNFLSALSTSFVYIVTTNGEKKMKDCDQSDAITDELLQGHCTTSEWQLTGIDCSTAAQASGSP